MDEANLTDHLLMLRLGNYKYSVTPENVKRAAFGMRIILSRELRFDNSYSSHLKAVPLLFIQDGLTNKWFCIEAYVDEIKARIPHKNSKEDIYKHINYIHEKSVDLLKLINADRGRLGVEDISAQPIRLLQDAKIKIVREFILASGPEKTYIIVTGSKTHILQKNENCTNCTFHAHERSRDQGVNADEQALNPQNFYVPRAYFGDGHCLHCTHRDITTAKSYAPDGSDPQCVIWPLEQRLCCRQCAFEEICKDHIPVDCCESGPGADML